MHGAILADRCVTANLCDKIFLDELVWREVVKLLESPQLIQEELERRLITARNASPAKRREDTLQRELDHKLSCAATRNREDVSCFRAPTYRPTPRQRNPSLQ
jgi:site-specific DNA recombinase